MGMPDEYDRDCEECGCFGGKQVTICYDCLEKMTVEDFNKLKEMCKE